MKMMKFVNMIEIIYKLVVFMDKSYRTSRIISNYNINA